MIVSLVLFVKIIPVLSIQFIWILRVGMNVHQGIIVQEELLLQLNVLRELLGKIRKPLNSQIVYNVQMMLSIIWKVKFLALSVEEEQLEILIMVSRTVSALVSIDNGVLQIISAFVKQASLSHLFLLLRVVYQLTYKIANLLYRNNVLQALIIMPTPNHV